ncbi:MAG: RsmB/NOP family class I SAM-dependent RNA methyltransferase [Thalassovita sp.]
MTPAARLQAAAELLDQILDGAPAEKVLTGWARRSRYAGSKDRAAIRDHVFDALRCRRSYAALGGVETGRGLMVGAVRAADQDPAEFFTGEGHAPAPLTEAEQSSHLPTDDEAMNLPDWVITEFKDSLGDHATDVAMTLQHRAPVMLRVNLRKTSRDQAIALLADEAIVAEPAAISDTALIVTQGPRKINNSAPYREGLVELQDGGSQALVDRMALQDGLSVLDYCAGGGGKTLAMAGRIKGRFYAHDANPRRLKDLPDRAKRAGVSVKLLEPSELSRHAPFDVVLCDAPCSGSGSWRRSPESKWSLTPQGLADLNATQDEILDTSQSLVGPGGSLVYATCSVLLVENQHRVAAFLEQHPTWRLSWQQDWMPGLQNDGFFAACLTRIAE